MTTFPDLHIMADMLGITLAKHNGGIPGYYTHATRTISTRRGMSATMYRTVLAHELGHATYNDQPNHHGHYDQKQETRANRFAARLLIPETEWETVKVWCDGRVEEMASELEVTPQLVEIYARHIERKNI